MRFTTCNTIKQSIYVTHSMLVEKIDTKIQDDIFQKRRTFFILVNLILMQKVCYITMVCLLPHLLSEILVFLNYVLETSFMFYIAIFLQLLLPFFFYLVLHIGHFYLIIFILLFKYNPWLIFEDFNQSHIFVL